MVFCCWSKLKIEWAFPALSFRWLLAQPAVIRRRWRLVRPEHRGQNPCRLSKKNCFMVLNPSLSFNFQCRSEGVTLVSLRKFQLVEVGQDRQWFSWRWWLAVDFNLNSWSVQPRLAIAFFACWPKLATRKSGKTDYKYIFVMGLIMSTPIRNYTGHFNYLPMTAQT